MWDGALGRDACRPCAFARRKYIMYIWRHKLRLGPEEGSAEALSSTPCAFGRWPGSFKMHPFRTRHRLNANGRGQTRHPRTQGRKRRTNQPGGYISGHNSGMTVGARIVLVEMAVYGSVAYGDPDGRGPFCIVPAPRRRVDPGSVSSELPTAEFCGELINLGLLQPLPDPQGGAGEPLSGVGLRSTGRNSFGAKRCYRVSEYGYETLGRGKGE